MLKRLFTVILFLLFIPLVIIGAYSIIITAPIAGIIYIVKGENDLFDFIFGPLNYVIELYYKIIGDK